MATTVSPSSDLAQWVILCLSLLSLVESLVISQKNVPQQKNTINAVNMNRRDALFVAPSSSLSLGAAITTFWLQQPRPSHAASGGEVTSVADLLTRLKGIPTFCIVNGETGASYMIVKADERMAKGYAFTTYDGAMDVLSDAQRTAKEKGYSEIWEDATITTIPADAAVRLSLTKRQRTTQKDDNQSLDSIMIMVPSAEDREDAIAMDKKFQDQGRVPLFYFDQQVTTDGDDRTLLYFSKRQLLSDWDRRNNNNTGGSNMSKKIPPAPRVVDLGELFQNTLRGRTDKLPRNVFFVPVERSVEVSKELKSKGLTPYKIDRMIV